MERIDAVLYLWLNSWSDDLARLAREWPDMKPFDHDDEGHQISQLRQLQKQCDALGFKTTSYHLWTLLALIDAGRTYSELGGVGQDINTSLFIEAQSTVFLALQPGMDFYYSETYQGWEAVIARFQDTRDDIEEARKCFALNRYAASVYHCMQVVETTLIELGRFLKIPKGNRPSWGATTAKLGQVLAKKPQDLTRWEKSNIEKLRQIHAVAAALQDAWRNKISHSEGRLQLLGSDFRQEIAGEIMTASLAFSRRLAVELPPKRSR